MKLVWQGQFYIWPKESSSENQEKNTSKSLENNQIARENVIDTLYKKVSKIDDPDNDNTQYNVFLDKNNHFIQVNNELFVGKSKCGYVITSRLVSQKDREPYYNYPIHIKINYCTIPNTYDTEIEPSLEVKLLKEDGESEISAIKFKKSEKQKKGCLEGKIYVIDHMKKTRSSESVFKTACLVFSYCDYKMNSPILQIMSENSTRPKRFRTDKDLDFSPKKQK